MNIDITTVCEKRVKSTVSWVVNKANDTQLQLDVDQIYLHTSSDKRILVKDVSSSSGVLISKLDIANLFPSNIDLRPFKYVDKSKQQITPELSPEQLTSRVNEFNKNRAIEMVNEIKDELGVFVETDESLLRDFFLFCKVTGFWELSPDEVTIGRTISEIQTEDGDDISLIEERVIITVVVTHPHYCGTVEALV